MARYSRGRIRLRQRQHIPQAASGDALRTLLPGKNAADFLAAGERVSAREATVQMGSPTPDFGIQLTPSPSNSRDRLQLLQQLALQDNTQHPTSPASDIGLRKHGSAPLQIALMQQMQRTHGNRAVQRLIQQKGFNPPAAGKIPSPAPEMAGPASVTPASSPQPTQDAKTAPEAAVEPETQPSASGVQSPSDKASAELLAAPPEESPAGGFGGPGALCWRFCSQALLRWRVRF